MTQAPKSKKPSSKKKPATKKDADSDQGVSDEDDDDDNDDESAEDTPPKTVSFDIFLFGAYKLVLFSLHIHGRLFDILRLKRNQLTRRK